MVAIVAAALAGTVVAGVALAPPDRGGGAPQPAAAAPRLSVKPERGFVDDAFALDAAGKRLAVIETDKETFQTVKIFELDAQESAPRVFELAPPTRVVESISFLPSGAGLLLVGPGADGARVAETVDLTGKVLGRTSLPADFATTGSGRDAKLVMLERREGRGGEVSYVVSPFMLPTLKPAGKPRTYPLGGDGALRPSGLVPVGFFEGYSKLLTRRPGGYDRKKDARQPDGQSVLDLLSGKAVSAGPIEDVYGWARVTRLRPERPNRTLFVQVAGANAGPAAAGEKAAKGEAGVELVDAAGRLTPLELAVPFRLYDRSTLKDQEGPAPGVLTFGLEVDPVNADAVARQKADRRALDVYGIAVGGVARLRARVALGSQPVLWAAAGDRVVVLSRFKSFARGGDRLDVYDLAN